MRRRGPGAHDNATDPGCWIRGKIVVREVGKYSLHGTPTASGGRLLLRWEVVRPGAAQDRRNVARIRANKAPMSPPCKYKSAPRCMTQNQDPETDSGMSAEALRQLHFCCKTAKALALRPRLCVGRARKRPSCLALGQALNLIRSAYSNKTKSQKSLQRQC